MNKLFPILCLLLGSAGLCAQSTGASAATGNFYARFSTQANMIQSHQPNWPPPLVTTYSGLFQVVRADFIRQITPTHTDTWNYGNSKGISLIPWNRTEIDVNLPPYIQHNNAKVADGAGDMSFLGKIRIASGNDTHGNYNLSAFIVATIPTGSHKNGSATASLTPSLAAGKGFGRLAIQTTAGTTLYTGKPATTTSGNPIAWNLAGQFHVGTLFWPEIESNATFFKGGANYGKTQEFVTPGLLIGKCKLHPQDPHSRAGGAFGAGMQIATSKYHSYNHELVLTSRWIF